MRRRTTALALALAPLMLVAFTHDSTTARYELRFDSSWSSSTHPQDFPSDPHFSGLVGGTHDASADFWELGGTASLGIERMAEWGSKADLLAEVDAAISAGDAFSRIDGPSMPVSPGTATVEFDMHADHPLVTAVTMLAPSPDWFVGTDALDLRPGGSWVEQVTVAVSVLDAGTDSGASYTAANADTQPREPIAFKTDGPFSGSGEVGSFTFTRVDVAQPVPAAGTWALVSLAALLGVALWRRSPVG